MYGDAGAQGVVWKNTVGLAGNGAGRKPRIVIPRRAEIVESVRGPGGGYKLGRPADAIRVSEILSAVDETMDALAKGAGASGALSGTRAQSLTNRFWEGLSAHVYVFLHQARLSDIASNQMAPCPAIPALFRVIDE